MRAIPILMLKKGLQFSFRTILMKNCLILPQVIQSHSLEAILISLSRWPVRININLMVITMLLHICLLQHCRKIIIAAGAIINKKYY